MKPSNVQNLLSIFTAMLFFGACAPSEQPKPQLTHADHLAKCNAGDFFFCNLVAIDLIEGKNGAAKDQQAGLSYFKRNCERKNFEGNFIDCYNYAHTLKLERGDGPQTDEERLYFQRACDAGYKTSCEEMQ